MRSYVQAQGLIPRIEVIEWSIGSDRIWNKIAERSIHKKRVYPAEGLIGGVCLIYLELYMYYLTYDIYK